MLECDYVPCRQESEYYIVLRDPDGLIWSNDVCDGCVVDAVYRVRRDWELVRTEII